MTFSGTVAIVTVIAPADDRPLLSDPAAIPAKMLAGDAAWLAQFRDCRYHAALAAVTAGPLQCPLDDSSVSDGEVLLQNLFVDVPQAVLARIPEATAIPANARSRHCPDPSPETSETE